MYSGTCASWSLHCTALFRLVYTKRQRQRCDHSAMTLAILFSLKSIEKLENGLQTYSGASSQSCHSVVTDAWCKRALRVHLY